jgi:hypothetical protein
VVSDALRQIFESMFDEEYLAWVPIYLVPGHKDDVQRLKLIAQTWQEAAEICGIETRCQCGILPGKGGVAERVIDLFENDSEVPALILMGMDSPLSDEMGGMEGMDDDDDADAKPKPSAGHAVVAMLLSRPGLKLPRDASAAASAEKKDVGVYTPYWERGDMSEHLVPGWGEMPEKYLPDFLEIKPLAALCRSRPVICPERKYLPVLSKALTDALIDAGVWKLPFELEQDGKPQEEAPGPLDLGWLVCSNDKEDEKIAFSRRARLVSGISGLGCDLDMAEECTILDEECGDVGAARSTLMLVVAMARAAQLQKPVLATEFGEGDEIVLGLVRPILPGTERG